MKKNQTTSADPADLRRQAEDRLREKQKGQGTKASEQRSRDETERLVHELQVHQIELEMQNEELLRARSEAESVAERYTDLYDFAPIGYFTLARDGTIQQVNLTGARLLGMDRSRLVHGHFGLFVSGNDRPVFSAFLDRVIESRSKETCEVSFRATEEENLSLSLLSGGQYMIRAGQRVVRIEGTASEDGLECRVVVEDITERKQMGERERLACEVLNRLNQPKGTTEVFRDILQMVKSSTGLEAVGIRLRNGDDFPYFETKGFPDNFVEMERYLCARDSAGKIVRDTHGNPILECMCGNILCGRTDPTLPFFTESGSFWSNRTTDLLTSTNERNRQSTTRNRCNSAGYESVALVPLRAGNEIIGLLQLNDHRRNRFTLAMIQFLEALGASIGIALARKRDEEALAESEVRFRTLADSAPDGIFRFDRDLRLLYANPIGTHWLGQEAQFDLPITEYDLPAIFVPGWKSAAREVFETGHLRRFETSIEQRGMTWTYGVIVAPELSSDGSIHSVISGARDITERKRIEEEFRQYAEGLEFLSGTTTRMLGNLSMPALYRIVADQIHAVAGGAAVAFNEFDPQTGKLVVRELRCTPEERDRLVRILGREPEGFTLDFDEEIRARMLPVGFGPVEGGLHDLSFEQLPAALFEWIEQELNIADVFAMSCSAERELLGTVAILTHERGTIPNKKLIESVVNQAALAIKRKRACVRLYQRSRPGRLSPCRLNRVPEIR